jgi:hypothetical protein
MAMPVLVPILTGSGERGLTAEQPTSPEHQVNGVERIRTQQRGATSF